MKMMVCKICKDEFNSTVKFPQTMSGISEAEVHMRTVHPGRVERGGRILE